jgi:hypothetical protein
MLRARGRDKDTDLTVEYLKELWEKQRGICPISKWLLALPKNTNGWAESHWWNASLDRIDNNIRYRQGNVRFIAVMANLGRARFSDEELYEFCDAVVSTQEI